MKQFTERNAIIAASISTYISTRPIGKAGAEASGASRPPPLKRNSISGIERKSSSVSSTRTLRRTTSKSI